jgi:hypothetical protein
VVGLKAGDVVVWIKLDRLGPTMRKNHYCASILVASTPALGDAVETTLLLPVMGEP